MKTTTTAETVTAIIDMLKKEADRFDEGVAKNPRERYAFELLYYTLHGLADDIRMMYGPVDGTPMALKVTKENEWK